MPEPTRHDQDLGIYGLPGDVSPWDLRFDPNDRAHLEPLGGGTFEFRVWAEPGLYDGALVVRNDGAVEAHALDVVETGRFWFWTGRLDGVTRPIEYSFAFRSDGGHPVYLVPAGVSNAVERLDRWTLDPALPEVSTPEWVRGAVIYQIFPDRFANGDASADPDDVVAWGSPPHHREFQGGDLVGVADRMDYLVGLGVEAIYLNPIFASPSNHRYDTTDYLTVDPALGGEDALRRLIDTAHRHDVRVILDASFNHVHPRFFAFADLVARGKRSAYRDWFVVNDWPPRILHRPGGDADGWLAVWRDEVGLPIQEVGGPGPTVEPTYDAWYGVPTMPRLDLGHSEVRSYLLDVARRWTRFGIDGWRMDVARYVDVDFWSDFRAAVREVRSDAYLLAEIMGDAGAWLQGDRFDATMNYTFRDLCLRFFARDEIDGATLLDDAARLWFMYPRRAGLANQNLLGSHDTPRFLTEAAGQAWRMRLATVFQMTFPGAPGLYYGDEVGLEGGDDPGSRGAFDWDDPRAHPQYRLVASLAELRQRHAALRVGGWRPVLAQRHLIAFERYLVGRTLLVVINRGRRDEVAVGSGRVVWGDGRLDAGRLMLPARSAAVVAR